MGQEPHPVTKLSKRKCKKEKMNESLDPMLGDESVGVENLLAEPKSDPVSVDGILCFSDNNIAKCLELEDFSHGFEYSFKTNFGGLGSFGTHTEDELKLEVLDGLLDGVDEVDDFHAASDLAGACEDFFLDVEFVGKVSGLECGPSDGSQLGNSTTESQSPGFSGSNNGTTGVSDSQLGNSTAVSQSPGFSGSNNGTTGVSDSSMETIPKLERRNEMDQKTVYCDTDELLRKAAFEDKKCFNTLEELDEEKLLMNFILSRKIGKSPVPTIKHCEPSRRFIAECSDTKSRLLMDKQEFSAAASMDKGLKTISRKLPHTRALALDSGGDSFCGASSQIPTESRLSRGRGRGAGRPKRSVPVLQWHKSDEELSASEPEDDCVKKKNSFCGASSQTPRESWPRHTKEFAPVTQLHDSDDELSAPKSEDDRVKKNNSFCGASSQTPPKSRPRRAPGPPKISAPATWHVSDDELSSSEDDQVKKKKSNKCTDRRKHQRMWTLSEVTTLIDGISQYGVSRWTDIKRRLFSSSAYRTPIDLRDKWRNLLKASGAIKRGNKEIDQKQKQATRPLPMSLLHRVRELADTNPYPMVCGSKRSHLDREASPPTVAAAKRGTTRNVRRKKYT